MKCYALDAPPIAAAPAPSADLTTTAELNCRKASQAEFESPVCDPCLYDC